MSSACDPCIEIYNGSCLPENADAFTLHAPEVLSLRGQHAARVGGRKFTMDRSQHAVGTGIYNGSRLPEKLHRHREGCHFQTEGAAHLLEFTMDRADWRTEILLPSNVRRVQQRIRIPPRFGGDSNIAGQTSSRHHAGSAISRVRQCPEMPVISIRDQRAVQNLQTDRGDRTNWICRDPSIQGNSRAA